MSWRALGLFIVLLILVATLILLVNQLVRSRARSPAELVGPLTEPIIKDVSAEHGWQNTGILLESSQTIHIQYMSGELRDGEAVIRGPSGIGWSCGESDCCEPMPDVERDALIGRVGDHLFAIGDRSEVTVSANGELQLRINDCDAGLFDNSGSFQVKISP
jgi:hypothetical protein